MSDFKFLEKISLKKLQRDEVREIGRNVRLDIPTRRLKNGEFFSVPVRVKQHTNIAEFTLRCEIPINTFVEFVRVVWPWEVDESSILSNGRDSSAHLLQLNSGFTAWDISQRLIPSPKGNVTEVVAQYRDTAIDPGIDDHFRDDPVIYKLLFRVVPPPRDSVGRIGPRFLWSLVSLSRKNTADQPTSGSPIVTRLDIESFEFKHLVLVVKSRSLVNTAVLSGHPSQYPVWVFGLTHAHELRDVTARSTCHTGDESVAHFPRDACAAGLTFSGGELGGAQDLLLVAKVDRTNAREQVTVWFPRQSDGVSLVVDQPREGQAFASSTHPLHEYSFTSVFLHGLTDNQQASVAQGRRPRIHAATSEAHFQQKRLRVIARSKKHAQKEFRLRFAMDYTGVVAAIAPFELVAATFRGLPAVVTVPRGGSLSINWLLFVCVFRPDFTTANARIQSGEYSPSTHTESASSPALDVTYLTAHCLRLEYASEGTSFMEDGKEVPVRLVLVREEQRQDRSEEGPAAARVWLVGRRPGRVRVKLASVADSPLVKAALPASLARLRKQQAKHRSPVSDGSPWKPHQPPILWVTVTDGDSIWPVGITAQLVTDLTVTVTQQDRLENQLPIGATQSHYQTMNKRKENLDFAFYTAHIRFSGSRVAWELGQWPLPFTLVIDSLRPDLVRVDMPPMPPSPPSSPPSHKHQKRSLKSPQFTFHRHGDKNDTQNAFLRPEWLGPTVFLLREDESFSGEFVDVFIVSDLVFSDMGEKGVLVSIQSFGR
ncbi:unnamed protein product [Mesocestoides corti]|uniref:Transmembrane protein family 132 fourth domain-containing protein n=1 Tax=Mesocestoides corti TaxID=53468 RepID=A0A158QT28_MESCO|nr:unnamed protein product [Mesocestoides corti]